MRKVTGSYIELLQKHCYTTTHLINVTAQQGTSSYIELLQKHYLTTTNLINVTT